MVIYYNNYEGELLRGETDGELTKADLADMLKRDDLILVPHDTYHLEAGAGDRLGRLAGIGEGQFDSQ